MQRASHHLVLFTYENACIIPKQVRQACRDRNLHSLRKQDLEIFLVAYTGNNLKGTEEELVEQVTTLLAQAEGEISPFACWSPLLREVILLMLFLGRICCMLAWKNTGVNRRMYVNAFKAVISTESDIHAICEATEVWNLWNHSPVVREMLLLWTDGHKAFARIYWPVEMLDCLSIR